MRGFAVGWMLVLVAVLALAAGASLQDVLFSQQLGNLRAHEQRAMGMAQLGLRLAMTRLSEQPAATFGINAQPDSTAPERFEVEVLPGALRVPEGFSAGRFVEHDHQIRSSGWSAQANRTLVQGITRLEPLAPAAP